MSHRLKTKINQACFDFPRNIYAKNESRPNIPLFVEDRMGWQGGKGKKKTGDDVLAEVSTVKHSGAPHTNEVKNRGITLSFSVSDEIRITNMPGYVGLYLFYTYLEPQFIIHGRWKFQ